MRKHSGSRNERITAAAREYRQLLRSGLADYDAFILERRDLQPELESELRKLVLIETSRRNAASDPIQDRRPPAVPDYDLICLIGQGGFGDVWIGRNHHDEQYCAVKVLHSGTEIELEGVREFKKRALCCEHLMPIGHVGSIDGSYYYIMPLADDAHGHADLRDPKHYRPLTLARHVQQAGPLDVQSVVDVALSLLTATVALHRTGGIHCDVKPSNVMRLHGHWRLADHGLVSDTDDVVAGKGTSEFKSPTPSSRNTGNDLYSLGRTILYMLTGGVTDAEAPSFQPNANTPRGKLDNVVARATSDQTNRRFSSAEQMQRALEDVLAKSPEAREQARSSRVYHYREQSYELLGELGATSFSLPVGDSVRVEITLTRRAQVALYSYDPSGTAELIVAPRLGEQVTRLQYPPGRDEYDCHEDAIGTQVYLAAWAHREEPGQDGSWWNNEQLLRWAPMNIDAVWRHTSGRFERLVATTRGRLRRSGVPGALEELVDRFERLGLEVELLAFPVIPRAENVTRGASAARVGTRQVHAGQSITVGDDPTAIVRIWNEWTTDELDKIFQSAIESWKSERHDEAIRASLWLREVYRLSPSRHSEQAARVHRLLADASRAQGRYEQAQEYLSPMLKEPGVWSERDVIMARSLLAVVLQHAGQYRETESLLRDVIDDCVTHFGPEHRVTLNNLGNLAILLDHSGALTEARQLVVRLIDARTRQSGPDDPATLNMVLQLGDLDSALLRYDEAASSYWKVAALGTPRKRCYALRQLGAMLRAMGDYEQAREHTEAALAGLTDLLGADHHATLRVERRLLELEGNLAQPGDPRLEAAVARMRRICKQLRRIVKGDSTECANFDVVLAFLEARCGNNARAAELANSVTVRARSQLGDRHLFVYRARLLEANLLLGSGNAEAARSALERLERDTQKTLSGYGTLTLEVRAALGDATFACGAQSAAIRIWEQLAEDVAGMRWVDTSFGLEGAAFHAERSPEARLALAFAHSGERKKAWERLDGYLARALVEAHSARALRPLTAREREEEQRLVEQLAEARTRLSRTESVDNAELRERLARCEAAQAALAQFSSLLRSRYGAVAGHTMPLDQIQASLPRDAALVAWVDVPSDADLGTWAVVVRSQGAPNWIRCQSTHDLHPALAELRASIRSPGGKAPLDALAQCRTTLWQPVAQLLKRSPDLPATKHLIVLPSSLLAGIPVDVLAPSLVVNYAPSGTMYAWLRKRQRTGLSGERPALVVDGNPEANGTSPGHCEIAGASREARNIAAVLPHSESLTTTRATAERLNRWASQGRLRRYAFLHFATHAQGDTVRALQSSLLLTSSRDSTDADERLTAADILRNWRLEADLVTLSACSTSLGPFYRGEGHVGFTQAFFLAGARTVVASLWDVDDTATSLLMERFYSLLVEQHDVARALHKAKVWLRELTTDEVLRRTLPDSDTGAVTRGTVRRGPIAAGGAAARPFASPYYWAAFVAVGAAD